MLARHLSIVSALAFAGLGFTATAWAAAQEEYAEFEAQCRQQAEESSISEDELAEYIDGCVLAMTGSPSPQPETNYAIESESSGGDAGSQVE